MAVAGLAREVEVESKSHLVLHSLWPIVRGALLGTIPLSLISFALGLAIALGIALMRISKNRLLQWLGRTYVSIIRGTPLLVQLFIIFFGLPNLGLTLSPWPSAIIAFSLNVGGYAAEVIRAAILSVPKGQREAAYTIGLSSTQTLTRIVLPQAMRVAVPPLSNTFISLVKDTSLAAIVLVTELTREAQKIAYSTSEFLLLYSEAAVVYWVICTLLSFGQDKLERRLERGVAI
ncbi:amino acid ABC transporter permease [Nocardioides sp. Kera G14]|nr:amino acid ABC transporter permease [Nocardioides sp. Kera G14]